MPAVALPAVGGAGFVVTTDHVPVPTVFTDAAAVDVIDHNAIAGLESLAARAYFHDLPRRLMPCDRARLVALGALPQVRAIDRADVAAADGTRLHLNQYLAVTWLGDFKLSEFHHAITRQNDALHLQHV